MLLGQDQKIIRIRLMRQQPQVVVLVQFVLVEYL
jgi:hypothetical protein